MRATSLIKSLTFKDDFRPLLLLAIPMMLTGVMQSSLSFIETIFLAHLNEQALAAGALVSWLFATLIVILFGTFSSVNVLIAHRYGAKDHHGIALVLRDGLLLAIMLTAPTFILFWYAATIFQLVGQPPALVALAKLYLHGLAWGLFPKFILIVLFEFLLGLGHSRIIMIITLLSIPLYLLFSYTLIFGKFGFPMLEIAGAGWGMTAGDWIVTTLLCLYIITNNHYRHYIRAIFTFKKPSFLWEILRIGVPMGMMYCIEVGFFFAVTVLMGLISIEALAANQIAMQYLGSLMGVIFNIAQAVTVRMGHQLGAQQRSLAERTAYTGILFSSGLMGVIVLSYWFAPGLLISVDFNVHDPKYAETIRFATQFLFIAAFFQLLEAIRISLFGALRGLKDTRFTLLSSIICFWFLALPIGYFFSIYLQLGGQGFWWGMVLGVCCNIFLLYKRFKFKMRYYRTMTHT